MLNLSHLIQKFYIFTKIINVSLEVNLKKRDQLKQSSVDGNGKGKGHPTKCRAV
jgi:hypothetical protein